ncbi:MAG: metal-dependent transcriptional regulator [Candidatus Methanodesulfokora sp.]|jgi:DtxR family Mn-dependent transcriptional regulator
MGKRECELLRIAFEEWPERIIVSRVSERLEISKPAAIKLLRSMERKGLISYRYRGEYKLTERGKKLASEAIRKHRIVETFLFQLGMGADEACCEASRFDFFMSRKVVERICDAIGRPEVCPHGKVIPKVRS